jgi:hypothetical protein
MAEDEASMGQDGISSLPDAGRDDHSAPRDSTWLRGALAQGSKRTSMAIPKVLRYCASSRQGDAAAAAWCPMSTAEQCSRDEGSMHGGSGIVGFPMRQGGSRGRCRRRGAWHGAGVTSAFVREDGRRVSRGQEGGLALGGPCINRPWEKASCRNVVSWRRRSGMKNE